MESGLDLYGIIPSRTQNRRKIIEHENIETLFLQRMDAVLYTLINLRAYILNIYRSYM